MTATRAGGGDGGGGLGGGSGGGGAGGGGLGVATQTVSEPAAVVLPRAQAAVIVWLLKHVEHVEHAEFAPPPAVTLPGRHAAKVQLPEAHIVHISKVVSAVALQATEAYVVPATGAVHCAGGAPAPAAHVYPCATARP